MWSPTPSVFSFLSSLLASFSPTLASEYPTIHFSILYALFQDSRRWVHGQASLAANLMAMQCLVGLATTEQKKLSIIM